MTAPRYISTPFCIWVSKPGVADGGGGSGREVGLLLWSAVLQSHSIAKHGAIVIDFIPLLWRKAIVYGDKNLVNVGWTLILPMGQLMWFCLTPRSGVKGIIIYLM